MAQTKLNDDSNTQRLLLAFKTRMPVILVAALLVLIPVFPLQAATLTSGMVQPLDLGLTNANSQVTTYAGTAGVIGGANGTGTAALFYEPMGIATDGTYLYVSEYEGGTIRKIEINSGTVTTLAGLFNNLGYVDGTGSAARFWGPSGLATDGVDLFVADYWNNVIRKVVISTGEVSTLAGSGVQGGADGVGVSAQFYWPSSLAMIGGDLYVADYWNNKIRKIVVSTGEVTTFAGSTSNLSGSTDAIGTLARFFRPIGITTDGTDLYVADTGNGTIRKIEVATGAVSTLAGSVGSLSILDGTGAAARFANPYMISSDGINLYVTEPLTASGDYLRKVVISTGEVSTIAGSANGYADGIGSAAQFNLTSATASDGTSLYLIDRFNHTIRKIRSTQAGNALDTDGVNDQVVLPRSIQDDFTIEYWVKTTQTGGTTANWFHGNAIVDAEVSGQLNDFGTSLYGSKIAFGTGLPDVTIFSTTDVNDGIWHHVAAVRNSSTGTLQLYIDGVLEATRTDGGTQSLTTPGRITIGSMQTDINYFDGTIDEVRLWNVARSEAEIQATMNVQLGSNTSGLAAYYQMDQGVAGGDNTLITTLTDTSAAGNDGTLNNFALTGNASNFVDGVFLFATPTFSATPNPGSNGSMTPSTAQTVNYLETTSFTVTPNTGFEIASVTGCGVTLTSGDKFGAVYTTAPVTADCQVDATFAVTTFTVSPSAGANGSLTPLTAQTVNYNQTTAFTVTPDTGYNIDLVTGCGGTLVGDTYTTGPITADCTVSATFSIDTFTVLPVAGDGGAMAPSTAKTVNYNNTTAFTVTPDQHYVISSITGCGGSQTSGDEYGGTYETGPITIGCTVDATFELDTYIVTPAPGGGGRMGPSVPQEVTALDTTSFRIIPDVDKASATVTGCGGSFNQETWTYTTSPITEDCTVTAVFHDEHSEPISGDLPYPLQYLQNLRSQIMPPSSLDVPGVDRGGYFKVSWGAASMYSPMYVLEEATNARFTRNVRVVYTGPDTSAWVRGRTPGRYYYRVKSVNIAGLESGWVSESRAVRVLETMEPSASAIDVQGVDEVPEAPAMTVAVNGQNVSLTWTSVASATAYTLFATPYPLGNNPTIFSMDMGTNNGFNITLPPGSAYYVAVKAQNANGLSDYSNVGLVQIGE